MGDLNENTFTAITDASSPVRKSVACVSYVGEGECRCQCYLIKYDFVVQLDTASLYIYIYEE